MEISNQKTQIMKIKNKYLSTKQFWWHRQNVGRSGQVSRGPDNQTTLWQQETIQQFNLLGS